MLSTRRSLTVEFGHCDPSGIVFNPNYFQWLDFSVHALLAAAGLTLKGLVTERGMDGIPLVDMKAKFFAPSRWGDVLDLEVGFAKLHRSAFEIEHKVWNAGTLAMEAIETRVWTVFDHEAKRIKAKPIPDDIVALFTGEKKGD